MPSHAPAGFGASVLANLPQGAGAMSKATGKELPAATEKLLAQAKATNDLVGRALKALEPYKNDNTPEGAFRIAKNYRLGLFDPLESAASQLADLAGLQASSQTQLSGAGSRALQFMIQRRQHTPRLPSSRQVEFHKVFGAGPIGSVSRLIKDDEGGFDSPRLMYEKLLQIQINNQTIMDEMQKQYIQRPGPAMPPPAPRP
jgi:hypothetical protein